jgi:hypothetical protein
MHKIIVISMIMINLPPKQLKFILIQVLHCGEISVNSVINKYVFLGQSIH